MVVIEAYTDVLRWIAENPGAENVGYVAHCSQWLGLLLEQMKFPVPAPPPQKQLYMSGTPDGRLYAFVAATNSNHAASLIQTQMEKSKIVSTVQRTVVPFTVTEEVVMLCDGVARDARPG